MIIAKICYLLIIRLFSKKLLFLHPLLNRATAVWYRDSFFSIAAGRDVSAAKLCLVMPVSQAPLEGRGVAL